ncbi:MAG: hypothetical protein JOZ82_04020 [Marmoricola sp.]|nr:hypothetical protein [Marmoricola sp.]
MRRAALALLVVLAVVAGVGLAFWRGSGLLPDPEGCQATVEGHTVTLDTEQAENATLIAAIGVRRGLPARAVSIALATAYQESKIRNLAGGDRDSIGIFQQRPSQGWGTAAQVRNPYYSINAFYDVLAKVGNYQSMRITEAAQRVQRSGFPEAYQGHAADARALASALTGYSPGGKFTCVVHQPSTRGSGDRVVALVKRAYGDIPIARTGTRQDVALRVSGASGERLAWSVAHFVVAHGVQLKQDEVSFEGLHWRIGRHSEKGWTPGGTGTRTRLVISMG